jgi:hypothetical protein
VQGDVRQNRRNDQRSEQTATEPREPTMPAPERWPLFRSLLVNQSRLPALISLSQE